MTIREHKGFLLSGGIYTTMEVPGSTQTSLTAINDVDQIVGVYDTASNTFGFLLNGGSYTTINVPGSLMTSANGINNDGEILGTYLENGIYYGYLLSGGSYTSIDVPSSDFTEALGINDAGQIVGNWRDNMGGEHGFLAIPETQAAPEPASLLLLALGLGGLAGYGWRKRRLG